MIDKAVFIESLLTLLKSGTVFVAYCLPGHNTVEFIVDDNTSPVASSRQFLISTWGGEKIEIKDRVARINYLTVNKDIPIFPKRSSTSWEVYENGIRTVTGLLRSTEGKVVVSRQKLLSDSRLDYSLIVGAIFDMFEAYDNAFRAVYYTPVTGAWCVCSPELLLHIDKNDRKFATVALAGTRNVDIDGAWDDKNVSEHSYVVRHISSVLKTYGITLSVSESETLAAGKIRHILTRISGSIPTNADKDLIERLLQSLHPTPAICGFPIEWSKEVIDKVESHNRECYGGYLAVEDDASFCAYVNLRCFAFEEGACCFWGGGGIMPDSVVETEWNESELKIYTTLYYIENALKQR